MNSQSSNFQKRATAAKGTVLLAGGTGFLGNEIGAYLVRSGWLVRLITRRRPNKDLKNNSNQSEQPPLAYPAEVHFWNGDGTVPDAALQGADAVVNLAGESIATGRWTSSRKEAILKSRVLSTKALVAGAQRHRIAAFVQTSAIGIYGDAGSTILSEESSSPAEGGFLVDVCRQWEAATSGLDQTATRLVILRTGVVLGNSGGALAEMLLPYEAGVGAVIGNGQQYISWIHISDYCRVVAAALDDGSAEPLRKALSGVYNAVGPKPLMFRELHEVLIQYYPGLPLGLSAVPIPGWVLRVGLGEKAAIVLQSQRVVPQRLIQEGFEFSFDSIEKAMADLLPDPHGDFAGCALLVRKQWVPHSIGRVWEFFSRAENLEHMTPSFLSFRIVNKTTPNVAAGTEISYRLKIHGLPVAWRSRIDVFEPQKRFVDTQLHGPYRTWHHEHTFEAMGSGPVNSGTLIGDKVQFKLPAGRLGRLGGQLFARHDIDAIFGFRARTVGALLDQ